MIINILASLIVLSIYKIGSISGIYIDNSSDNDSNMNITTKYGQIYDCIDFYKQITFRNPLVKNYTLKEINKQKEATPLNIGLHYGELCPIGTIPILRTEKSKYNLKDYFATNLELQDDPTELYHCYAIVRTNNPSSKFYGISGAVTIYAPVVHGTQWSASRMRLQNALDSIEVGWMVNPTLFKDTFTHFYIRYVVDGKECFNLQCSGYVHVSKDVPVGIIADRISVKEQKYIYWVFSIVKKQDDNWWLLIVTDYGVLDIGFWPKSIFTYLTDFATQVEWGGEVYYPQNIPHEPPQMGSGSKAVYDTGISANYMYTKIINDKHESLNPPQGTIKVENCKSLYTVLDWGYQGEKWGRLILFGGPT